MVQLVKATVLTRYGCESWTIKKAQCQRIDAFELWCWRRLLRVPWTARRSNQSILKEISPEYSLEGLMLKLKPQYFGPLMQRTDSLEKTLMLGKIEGRRRWGGWMASPTLWTWVWASSGSWHWTRKPGMLLSMGITKSQTQLNYWTELIYHIRKISIDKFWRPGFDPWVRKIPWRRKWQPTPVLLPGKFLGLRSFVGYRPWDWKELDMTEWHHFHFSFS